MAYGCGQEEGAAGVGEIPRSLNEAIDDLEGDNEFLKPVFNKGLIDTYIDLKRESAGLWRRILTPWKYTIT